MVLSFIRVQLKHKIESNYSSDVCVHPSQMLVVQKSTFPSKGTIQRINNTSVQGPKL